MYNEILKEIRAVSDNLGRAVLKPLAFDASRRTVEIKVITDRAFNREDEAAVKKILRGHVPAYFACETEIEKLTPDCAMIEKKIKEIISSCSKALSAVLREGDISVTESEGGFHFTVFSPSSVAPSDICKKICDNLSANFCGEFSGEIKISDDGLDNLEVEESVDEPDFDMPVRTFKIEDFQILEGEKILTSAVYLSDLNLAGEEVVICGVIQDIRERSYTNKNGVEKVYYNFAINDTTATAYATYFPRLKTLDKIKALKVGDSIVCTGVNEPFNGNMRYTAKRIDLGKIPSGFVPEKRTSKPCPMHFRTVKPQPFTDLQQTDIFTKTETPQCLFGKTFVVFDLETTGLNSSPVSGNMDKIIEIGAYKIIDGEIKECFSTFINPQKKLSDEIISLTGITEEMVKDAPTYEEVMPDFYKFCYGSILVGHNIAGFDYKFVDYYWSSLGYIMERKLIDTIPLSQELLFLSNYKLNTVADRFNVVFNHHRATDDALATAKIFIELIKMKKSLPKLQ